MSNENKTSESAAVAYVKKELEAARIAAKRSKQVGIFLAIVICGYFSVLTFYLNSFLEPKTVAQVATGQALVAINANATQFAEGLERETRTFLNTLPDKLMDAIPELRQKMENELTKFARLECQRHASELGDQMDVFLAQNSDALNEFVQASNDEETVRALADELGKEFIETLTVRPDDSQESLSEKLQLTLDGLQRMEQQLAKLAQNEKLSEYESSQRKAIAIIARAAESGL